MRLLNTNDLTVQIMVAAIPDYVALSHTWENEEVTFADIQDLNIATKLRGFAKLREAARIAKSLSYNWIWIDTCCTIQSHHRYLCPTKVAAYAAEDGGRMYIAIQYKCSNVALLSHLFIKKSLFHTLIPDPNLVQRA
jgi:hypothetical protein